MKLGLTDFRRGETMIGFLFVEKSSFSV